MALFILLANTGFLVHKFFFFPFSSAQVFLFFFLLFLVHKFDTAPCSLFYCWNRKTAGPAATEGR